MKRTVKPIIAGMLLTACMSISNAKEVPEILNGVDYQVMHQKAMGCVVGQGGNIGGSVEKRHATTASGRTPTRYPQVQGAKGGIAGGGEA